MGLRGDQVFGPRWLIFLLGVEYLPGYVLIVQEHAGTIFTPQNNLSCKKFQETPYFGALWGTTFISNFFSGRFWIIALDFSFFFGEISQIAYFCIPVPLNVVQIYVGRPSTQCAKSVNFWYKSSLFNI